MLYEISPTANSGIVQIMDFLPNEASNLCDPTAQDFALMLVPFPVPQLKKTCNWAPSQATIISFPCSEAPRPLVALTWSALRAHHTQDHQTPTASRDFHSSPIGNPKLTSKHAL